MSEGPGMSLKQEIERAHDGAPALGHDVHEACADCGAIRVGPYCHACGQDGHVHIHAGALVHDLAHGVFHFEGKIWRTLPLLAIRPGELTRRYIAGERTKFVSPMALFLFSVFLMFAVVSNLAGHGAPDVRLAGAQQRHLADLEKERATTKDDGRRVQIDKDIAEQREAMKMVGSLKGTGFDQPGMEGAEARKAFVIDKADTMFGIPWLDQAIGRAAENPELLVYKMKSYGYKYSWALIPLSLPFIWLIFAFRRDLTLYHHAIFAIYSLAFMSLVVVVLSVLGAIGLPTGLLVWAALLIPPVHMYRQLKGTYGLGGWGAAWRTVALLVITLAVSLTFLLLLFYLGSD